ncbi:hypothetical protein [Labilibaculum antarcticum]|uniref:DUF3137 domain-containing protein n=1 Tax=Labilibaculum antarcticum TaxID=1717717 RepID=A0A1Y1CIA6_9BACT|nr:hypothetical protein [Labilibaculum antarcticum]BAX80087.1 hypothetical protein ALGA_1713 [Labilibaculum antarcticum]
MSKEEDKTKIEKLLETPSHGYTDNFSKREMWKEIAKTYHGEFKIKSDSSHALEIHNITIPYKKWQINISVSDSRPLKFRVTFASRMDFDLMLSWEDFMERILKKFGKPEIEVGSDEFDKRYLIKSSQPRLARQLLEPKFQKSLLEYNVYSLSYETIVESKKAELLTVIQRRAGSKDFIVGLINMHIFLIDSLVNLKIIS